MAVETSVEMDQFGPPIFDVLHPEPESFQESVRLHQAIKKELAIILASPSFRTSRKSCEFLWYIVQVTLDGRVDALKERSIGMDLLGRDVSYDPSSDATVRVRANEVRKRLTSFYSTRPSPNEYRIELLPGSYIPSFILNQSSIPSTEPVVRSKIKTSVLQLTVLPLSTLKMAFPALIAFFLCALFLRQQTQSADPYHQFWDKRLRGKSVMLVYTGETESAEPGSAAQAMLPMIWLAGRYDLKLLTERRDSKVDEKRNALAVNAVIVHSTESTPPEFEEDKRLRYLISTSNGEPHLTDRLRLAADQVVEGEAAMLTLLPEDPEMLWFTGTNWQSINTLTEVIASKNSFPQQLNVAAESGHIVQAVWRKDSSPQLQIYIHQP